MRFVREHTLNGITYEAGQEFEGTVTVARFLYQRGVLEPAGDPGDDLITLSGAEYKARQRTTRARPAPVAQDDAVTVSGEFSTSWHPPAPEPETKPSKSGRAAKKKE